jgi:UDP-GlcNAc:undecaprenyl-phosphate GlcNAc-1-phosphate transferase
MWTIFTNELGGQVLLAFFSSLLVALSITPFIIRASHIHDLTAKPNYRSSHQAQIANSGGIALFISTTIAVLFFSRLLEASNALFIIIAALVLFFTGVIDDYKPMPVIIKFIGQFLPAILMLLSMNKEFFLVPFFIYSSEWPSWVGYFFWVLSIVAIINTYNFIDGIDALIFQFGTYANLVFGIYFLLAGEVNLAVIAFALAGGILGIYRYNVRQHKKIFLGDSGSLLIGGLIGLFSIKFLDLSANEIYIQRSALLLGILFVPVADFFRVIIERLTVGKSPFSADRRHIHHIVLDHFKYSHQKTSMIILVFQMLITGVFYLFNMLIGQHIVLFSLIMLLSYLIGFRFLEKHWNISVATKI